MKLTSYKLSNNESIPSIGIGTWQIPEGENLVESLVNAIDLGYRYIDTAAIYENEASVGEAIKRTSVNRKDLFILSKCWTSNRTYDSVMRAFDATLKRLQVEYLDAYLIHWPFTKGDPLAWQSVNVGTWRAFERLHESGLVKNIGVSNFQIHHLVSFLARANIAPVINQIEYHPGYMQKATVQFCQRSDIQIQAWSPLGHGELLHKEEIETLAAKYGKSPSQVILRWIAHHNIIPITKSMNPEHQKDNLESFNFELTEEDIALLDKLPIMGFSGLEPDHVSFWFYWNS